MSDDELTTLAHKIDNAAGAVEEARRTYKNAGRVVNERWRELENLKAAVKTLHPDEYQVILGKTVAFSPM